MTTRTLQITKDSSDRYVVDEQAVPGMPLIGAGRTLLEALGEWFHHHHAELGFRFDVSAIQADEDARRLRELSQR